MRKTKTKRKSWKNKSVKDNPIDVYIGKRLKHFRWLAGMTQADLADKVDVKFQQIQKYETGGNRLSISRAVLICAALEISINELMGQYGEIEESQFMRILNSRETLKLGRLYMQLTKRKREKLIEEAEWLARR